MKLAILLNVPQYIINQYVIDGIICMVYFGIFSDKAI